MFTDTFSIEFINQNKEYLDFVIVDTIRDTLYAILLYMPIIIIGMFV